MCNGCLNEGLSLIRVFCMDIRLAEADDKMILVCCINPLNVFNMQSQAHKSFLIACMCLQIYKDGKIALSSSLQYFCTSFAILQSMFHLELAQNYL